MTVLVCGECGHRNVLRSRFEAQCTECGSEDLEPEATLAASLGQLKGPMMKMGQMLGYVDVGLPEGLRSAFSALHTSAQPIAAHRVHRVLDEALGQPEVQFMPRQPAVDLLGVLDLDEQFDPGVPAPELGQHAGQQVGADRRARPDRQPSPPDSTPVGHRFLRRACQGEQAPRVVGQEFTGSIEKFFPVGVWFESVTSQSDIDMDKAAGLNTYVELTDNSDLPLIRADPVQLQRVLANLVENAVKFSPSGEPVRVSAGGDARVVVSVTNGGRTIPPSQRPHVFEPFFRAGDGAAGSGLGLAICRGFVEANGGRIQLQAHGSAHCTTFNVSFPPARRPSEVQ